MQDIRCYKTMTWRLLAAEDGQMLYLVAFSILGLIGAAGLAVDAGHAYVAQRQLQASVNAVAIAAAEELPNADYQTVGQSFGSATGEKNAYAGLNAATPVVTGKCYTTVENWGIPCTTSSPNAVVATETAQVPTYFARVFGFSAFNVGAMATAATKGSSPLPYNVAIIVDTTLSMNTVDSNCNNVTQMQCALNGVQQLLLGLSPSIDHVSLFTFPNVASGASTAGIVKSGSYTCTTAFPTNQGYYHDRTTSSYTSVLTSPSGQMGTESPWSGAAWAMPYTFPPIPTSTSGYSAPSGTYGPTYQVVPFSEDYRTSDTATTLNSSSNLVKAAGGVSGCGGIAPSNYDGDYGTYYAGAIYAAEAALLAEQKTDGTPNAIVILGDGDSNGPNSSGSVDSGSPSISSTATQIETTYSSSASSKQTNLYTYPSGYLMPGSSGTYPSWVGECGQAITAAQYAVSYSGSPTKIYTVAYGASTQSSSGMNGDCPSDVGAGSYPNVSPCTAMQDMASSPDYFYSDYYAPGGDSGCQAPGKNNTITSLQQIFQSILTDMTSVRLIPNNTQ